MTVGMLKDYSQWHQLKTRIEHDHPSPLFREREIWWCSLGSNIGIEEDGKHDRFERPVLVVRKFNREMLWILPLSTKLKEGPYYHQITLHGERRTILLSQQRTISAKRLIRRLAKISEAEFDVVIPAVTFLYNKTDSLRSPQVPNGNL